MGKLCLKIQLIQVCKVYASCPDIGEGSNYLQIFIFIYLMVTLCRWTIKYIDTERLICSAFLGSFVST